MTHGSTERTPRTDLGLPADWWRELDRAVVLERLGRHRLAAAPFGPPGVPPLHTRPHPVAAATRRRGV